MNQDPHDNFKRARDFQNRPPWDELWAQADAALALRSTAGRAAASTLAKANRLSPAYVRQMINAAAAFPAARRDPRLTFTHHRFAAMTDQPDHWLKEAAEHDWSCRAMELAIRPGQVLATASNGRPPHRPGRGRKAD